MSEEQHPADKAPPTMTLDPDKQPGDPARAARNIAEAIEALTSDVASLLGRVSELEAVVEDAPDPEQVGTPNVDGLKQSVETLARRLDAWDEHLVVLGLDGAERTATPTHFVAQDMDGMPHLLAIAHVTHAWPIAEGVEVQIAHGRGAMRLRIPFSALAGLVNVILE